jgi:hypothetical protein
LYFRSSFIMFKLKDLFGSFTKTGNSQGGSATPRAPKAASDKSPNNVAATSGSVTLVEKTINAKSREDFVLVMSEAKVAAYFKTRGTLLEIEPLDGIVELRLSGPAGYEFVKLKTPVNPLTKTMAAGYLDEARNVFLAARRAGSIKRSELAILVIDMTYDDGAGEPADAIIEGLTGQIKAYNKGSIDPEVGRIQLLVKAGSAGDTEQMITANVRATASDDKKLYSVEWTSPPGNFDRWNVPAGKHN